jgi:hypothetical protein
LGELLRLHADAIRLEQALETLSLTDPGAPGWIRNQLLKRPGMKWDTDHAAALMNLVAVRESGQSKQSLRALRGSGRGSGQDWQTRKIA